MTGYGDIVAKNQWFLFAGGLDSNHQYPDEKLPAIDRRLAVFPGSKKEGLRRARCGFLACWRSCCSRLVGSFAGDQVRRLLIGF